MIKNLSIKGFRGFGEEQKIEFALPNDNEGSGLTIITGANNSGKTTIIESIKAFNGQESPSFSEGRRNKKTQKKVELSIEDSDGNIHTIKTIADGSSTIRDPNSSLGAYIVPSRRGIAYEFGNSKMERKFHIMRAHLLENERNQQLHNFEERIFEIEKDKNKFNLLLQKVLGIDFLWCVEQRDSGQYYIKYTNLGIEHSAEGIGDGIWSIFTICAALFDAESNSIIVIDEPELSVHPTLQKKLMQLLMEHAKDKQIIISTHSPYFIDWHAICNGARLLRVVKEGTDSKCYSLSNDFNGTLAKKIKGIIDDIHNPHVLGLEAKEVFFLADNIILVEGQEDVLIYQEIAKALEIELKGEFFGWGTGGAAKMEIFLKLFKCLGYKKVVCILDGDKIDLKKRLEDEFIEYSFLNIPLDDIRDKEEKCTKAKIGITDSNGNLKDEHKTEIINLFEEINRKLS